MSDPNILVVEDENLVAMDLKSRLKELGFEVSAVVASGEEAVLMVQKSPPDAILMDIKLRGQLDGIETAQQIRTFSDVPVIFLTAYSEESLLQRAKVTEPHAYLIKPFVNRELKMAIDLALARHASEQAQKEAYQKMEQQVAERTAELFSANTTLRQQFEEISQTKNQVVRQSALLKAINKIFYQALSCDNEAELWRTCLKVAQELTGSQMSSIGEIKETGRFDIIANIDTGWEARRVPAAQAICLLKSKEIRDSILKTGQSLVVNEPSTLPETGAVSPDHFPITSFLGVPLKGASGRLMGMIALANKEGGYDAADQEEVEHLSFALVEALQRWRSEAALRESEEKYRLLVNQIPAVVYKMHTNWSLDCFDRKIEEITGYSKEDFDSRRVTWLDLIFPEDMEEAQKRFREALKTKQFYINKHRIRKKDGEIHWVEARNHLICDASGKPAYFSGVFFDITERINLEDQLIKAQRMEAVGILAGGLAHDFNNLLTTIMGYSEMIMMGHSEEDPFHLYAEEITKSVTRGAALTNQLLAFSRKQILQPRVINLNEVVLDMDKMLRRLIGEDIELITLIDQELGFVKVDPGQIEQIVMNLAVNARDAMPQGGKLSLETANIDLDDSYCQGHVGVTPGSYVMLAVSDSGSGMDAETLSRIFEPFFTTKEIGKGTGLGLATVYGIVKQSGGNIWVYSEPQKGTTFKIYLPRVEDSEQPKPAIAPTTSLEGDETILLVEDDAAVRDLVSIALQNYGYKVLETVHGNEALLICEREKTPIHLMLTDVVMPEISGRVLAERLTLLHPEMKVLYMSGYTENAIVHHGVLNSNVNFIAKPFKVQTLVQKVREVLDTPPPS